MIFLYEIIEKFLAVFLSVMSTMGMFLTGCLFGNLLCGELSYQEMWIVFLVSLALTAVLFPIMMEARLERMIEEALEADSMTEEQRKEARDLCEHLRV
jgi:phosphotransferase system  glucose/maltose/N-acetylglucosamine-specific IIC component